MQLKLWQQVNLSLLLPVLMASVIILYAVHNLGTISKRVDFIETADDINITLLELRRYEKNILLFKEKENARKFQEYLGQLDQKIRQAEKQIVGGIDRRNYKPLLKDIETYKEAASKLISSMETEQRLLEAIRPLGRLIETNAVRKERALQLRRHEKNYIIYKERSAVDKLHLTAKEMLAGQPGLSLALTQYGKVFDSLTLNEAAKEDLIGQLRRSGRAIEKITLEFSQKKRNAIDRTITASRKMLFLSFLFLVATTSVVACLFSINVVRTLKTMEMSFARLKAGDFASGLNMDDDNAPAEILSFAKAYNQTIHDLGASKTELENTLKKIEVINRELIAKQDELVEARKLSAMRLLSSEIAHEINNPLSTLTTFLGMFHEDMTADDPRKETLTLMMTEAARCQSILRELVEFASREPLKLEAVNPAKLIGEAVEVVRRQNDNCGITVSTSFKGLPHKVLLDPVLFCQALINVLTNAYQVTPPGGRIDIHGYGEADSMIIDVKDRGPGIPKENLPYIFEPFFSTRKETGGTGLGLAISKKILERHRGTIRAESSAGEETVVKMKLPVVRGEDG
jgi:two-component system NtrC family sensor kinase